MRISSFVVSLSLLTVLSIPSFAQAPSEVDPAGARIPAFILEGLHQLALQNPDGAERAWSTGTSAEPDARALRSLMADVGAYQNFDVVKAQDLTPHLRVIYLALNFERQPDIVRFLLYRTTNGWILIDHRFNIDERIFEPLAQPAGE
ncbi:MAG: hypothetical protein WAL45_08375 [Terracidiphilus sp.]